MLKRFVKLFGGDPNKKAIDQHTGLVAEVNAFEAEYETLSDEALRSKTDEFRARLAGGEELDDLLPEAFAAVREASKRTIGLRHYDVQIIGGTVLNSSKIAEMRTGEGKTLVATLPVYLNALTGKGVHLITVNDYLARRDARWMAPIYNALGLSVGVLQMAARTENGKRAFLVDLQRESPHEDQNQLRMVPRAEAYSADITYGTNSEFGFDYLRDNMAMRFEDRVQGGHYFAIIDEVDNVLIDEARTPLIISGPAQDEGEWYNRLSQVVRQLRPEDVEVSEKDRNVTLTEIGEVRVEELLGMALRDPDRPEDVTPEQARTLGYLEQALRAQYLFHRNKEYLVQGGKVVIVDEFTGRLMPGRRWSDGLHQAVEAKEGVKVQAENVTYATITIQNYFRMYEKLAGMSGTALTEAEEFDKIYKLGVVSIPTNLEYQAMRAGSGLVAVDSKDEAGYKYQYYARQDDAAKAPIYYKRKDYPDIVYRTQEAKLRALTREIVHYHVRGRPILVGTTSVDLSERVSTRLRAEPLRRQAQVLLLRQVWFEKNKREEDGRQMPELQFLNEPIDQLDIAAMRKMSRDLEISFNPEEPANAARLLDLLELSSADLPRLLGVLQAGIPHEVLNARKHTEESQIIAGAGSFGAVTIATNMAGRGVDIKLGGELAEEILAGVNRVLKRAGQADPYDLTMDQRLSLLKAMDPAEYGIYQAEVDFFFQHMKDMDSVRVLGGLHVIGSERHEARRIDNQLRGRSARQGDPGSSRFYLSMEDELMRLFGGQQADGLMQRMKIDDAMPLEVGLVSRIVEQSQTRVEGSNFDVRKHLLEYDDVLNAQRAKIYAQRNLIFTKDDLSEDVAEMLRVEVNRRVPEALADAEGPWKLLAWLEQIQPPLQIGALIFPSYTQRLLIDKVMGQQQTLDGQQLVGRLLEIAASSIQAEEAHLLTTVNHLLDQAEDRLKTQTAERMEAVDAFFDTLSDADETDIRTPRQLADELAVAAHLQLRLTPEQMRSLKDDPRSLQSEIAALVADSVSLQAVIRLVGSIERRLEEPLELNPAQLAGSDWNSLADQVLDAMQAVFANRQERFLGPGGQIARDLNTQFEKASGTLTRSGLLQLLMNMTQGARSAFDKRTHRRVVHRTTRFTYIYYAATLLENRDPEQVTEEVLKHLEEAQGVIRQAWGASEWSRVAVAPISELDTVTQNGLQKALGDEVYRQAYNIPLQNLTDAERDQAVSELGRRTLTAIYRQLLLSVITELWVDYLTQMEGLRVSIGLEAYAQRDPLVQYKSRAYGLFQDLLNNMRSGLVNRMFTYRPRDLSSVQSSVSRSDGLAAEALLPDEETPEESIMEAGESDAGTASDDDDSGVETGSNGSVGKNKRRRRKKR